MKRFLICLIGILILVHPAYAADTAETDEYKQYLNNYDLSVFEDNIDKDTYSLIEELGLDDFDFESITSLSFEGIVNIIIKMLKSEIQGPLKGSLTVLAFIILSTFFQSFKAGIESSLSDVYSTASALIIAVIIVTSITPCISSSATAIAVAADFIFAFIPVFCAIVAASGGAATSFSTNSMLLMLAQGLSFVASNIFMPLINCFLALGICSSLKSELNIGRFTETLKRCITSLISISAATFVSVLSIKTAVASRADALGLRSIRFAINSVVPVIGSAISEGLLSIQSYSSLIKSSVGVVGIVAVALVFLPSILQIVIWRFFLSVCTLAADMFSDNPVSSMLRVFKDVMLLINVVLILSMVTTIISIGILIAAKT